MHQHPHQNRLLVGPCLDQLIQKERHRDRQINRETERETHTQREGMCVRERNRVKERKLFQNLNFIKCSQGDFRTLQKSRFSWFSSYLHCVPSQSGLLVLFQLLIASTKGLGAWNSSPFCLHSFHCSLWVLNTIWSFHNLQIQFGHFPWSPMIYFMSLLSI